MTVHALQAACKGLCPDYPDYPTNIHRPLSLSSSAETVVVRPAKIIENPVEASHSRNIQGYTQGYKLWFPASSTISGTLRFSVPVSLPTIYINLQALECPHVGPEPFVP